MSAQPRQLGLILDSFDVPAWVYHALERVLRLEGAEFSLILLVGANDPPQKSRRAPVYDLLNRIDEKIFARGQNASAVRNARNLLPDVPVIRIATTRESGGLVITPEDLKTFQKYPLDILIHLSRQPISVELLPAARYGVWYYACRGQQVSAETPPGFWEVAEGCPDMSISLMSAHLCFPQGRAIYRSRFQVYPFSPARTRNTVTWAASSFLSRQVRLAQRLTPEAFLHETARRCPEFDFFDGPKVQPPNNADALKHYSSLLLKNVGELAQRAFRREAWRLMVSFSESAALTFADFQTILPPPDRFWADPQVIRQEERYFIFVEEFIYTNRKGHIAVLEMDAHGRAQPPQPVLETNYHLSYPFVFEYDNQYYMVPETAQNHSIDLYECVQFPTRWQFKMRLMENVTAVDTTLLHHNGKWWLFTGITETPNALPEVELFLFSADTLFTNQWRPHPRNPIVSDVTCARPAGKLFLKEGRLYRPSQNCSKNYGAGFNLQEVVCLTESEYCEKTAAQVKPNWDHRLVAAHTFTRGEGVTIIDAASRRRKF